MSDTRIIQVATLPTPGTSSRIGTRLEALLPAAGTQPTQVTKAAGGNGLVPYRTYWYSDGMDRTRVSYLIGRDGTQAPYPRNIEVHRGDTRTEYWATRGDGVINWQQSSRGGQPDGTFPAGSSFENLLDANGDGSPDVLVQGFLGGGANRFEQL